MTLWDTYLLLLSRIGLARKPSVSDAALATSLRAPSMADAARLPQLNLWRWFAMPAALALALAGQWSLSQFHERPVQGAALMIVGLAVFLLAVWHGALDVHGAAATSQPETIPLPGMGAQPTTAIRWRAALGALILSGLTFLLTGNNNFSVPGRISWAASLIVWLAAFWEGPVTIKLDWQGAINRLWRGGINLRLSRTVLLLIAVLIVSAYFRFAMLNEVPIAMTSDHVEKLRDVNDILNNGLRPIFEPTNGGREPLEFYLAAVAARFAGTGLTYLTLKIVSSAAGFLTLPLIFLFAREVSDDDLTALIATLAAGIAWWPNVLSRNGLRLPLAPLFATLALWLIVRAIKRDRRNDALLAGLAFGIGLYGYTPIRAAPLAIALAPGLFALFRRSRGIAIKLVGWFVMLSIVAAAASVPMIRYAMDEPENFWRRTVTRIGGDPGMQATPTWEVLARNEVNSLLMFSWTADSAWLVSPAGQPALDWVMGGLFALGVGLLIYRIARRRDWLDVFLLAAIPILLLPSTLALAFPIENPSVHRSGCAMPIIFTIAAIPLRLLIEHSQEAVAGRRGAILGIGLVGVVFAISAQANWAIVFEKYADQYKSSVQNSPEIGAVVRGWATSIGDWDTAFIRAYPYWVDARAVGYYAGEPGWDNGILEADGLDDMQNDPRPKLYVLNRNDADSVALLRALYPNGKLAYHPSQYSGKDFLTYFVPGKLDFDERLITPTP